MIEFISYASGSSGNLYTISDGKTRILIEMGLPIKKINALLNYDMDDIEYALCTHLHQDHSKAIKDIMKMGIDVYSSQGTIDTLGLSGHRIHAVKEQEKFTIGSWTVIPLDTNHDVIEPFCYLLTNDVNESFLFATDTYYIKYLMPPLFGIAVECNYSEELLEQNIASGKTNSYLKNRIQRSHFSLEHLIEFFKANDLSKVEVVYLIHLSANNADKKLIKTEIQKAIGKLVVVC